MPTGALSYCQYGLESTFGTGVTCNKQFGHGLRVNSWSLDNSVKPIYGLGNPEAATYADGPVNLEFSVEFEMTGDGQWLKALMGAVADGGSAPYTHTYTKDPNPPSMTIELQFKQATDLKYTITGAIITDSTITIETGDSPVHVSLSLVAKTVTEAEGSYSAPSAPADNVWSFGQASIVVDGTTLGKCERAEVKIGHEGKLIYGLGSRLAAAKAHGKLTYSARVVSLFEDHTTLLDMAYGSAGALTPVATAVDTLSGAFTLTFDNGQSGSAMRKVVMTFGSPKIVKHAFSGLSVEDAIMEDVEINALTLSIVVSNNTSSGS